MLNRRKFFRNLAASVATLVTAHALPLQKIGRLFETETIMSIDLVSLPHYPAPDKLVAIFYKREGVIRREPVPDPEWKNVKYQIYKL